MAADRLETALPEGVKPLRIEDAAVLGQHDRLRRLFGARLDQGCADLLATPEDTGSGARLAWRAPNGGEIHRPATPEARQALRAEADDRLRRIAGLADELATQGDVGAAAATLIRAAIVFPPDVDPLFQANDAPLLVLWGTGTADQAAALVSSPVLEEPPTEEAPPPPASSGKTSGNVLWAIPAILALAAGWLGVELAKPLPIQEIEVPAPAIAAVDPTEGIPERIATLDAALREAAAASGRYAAACQAPEPASSTDGFCPAGAIAVRPREVMVVLDATGSMDYPIDTPDVLEARLMRAFKSGDNETWRRTETRIKRRGGQSRMSVARRAILGAIGAAPPNVGFGLLTFHDCTTTMFRGRYSSGNIGRLGRELERVEPSSGTALAVAINRAASLIEGGRSPADPVNMVLISDGYDACGGDPCAAARAAKAALPGLVINVLDLAQVEKLACIADATGGDYARLGDQLDVSGLANAATTASGAGAGRRCVPVP